MPLLQKYILSDVKNYIDIIESEDLFELEEFAFLLDEEFVDAEINHYIEEKIYEHLNELIDMECHMTKARCSRIIENTRRDIAFENRLHLFEQLEHHQYIGSYKEVENDEILYRVFSKRVSL